jgi:hypothetical protein
VRHVVAGDPQKRANGTGSGKTQRAFKKELRDQNVDRGWQRIDRRWQKLDWGSQRDIDMPWWIGRVQLQKAEGESSFSTDSMKHQENYID